MQGFQNLFYFKPITFAYLDLSNITTAKSSVHMPSSFHFISSLLCAFSEYSLHVCCLGILGLIFLFLSLSTTFLPEQKNKKTKKNI